MRAIGLTLLAMIAAVVIGWGLWAAVAWTTYGHPASHVSRDTVVDGLMPTFEVDEWHERIVAAPPTDAMCAVQHFALAESPVISAMIRVRGLMLGTHDDLSPLERPFAHEALAIGWSLLAERPGRELVYGTVTQPWHGDVQFRALSRDAFVAFDTAGYVKIVWTIAVDSLGPQRTRLHTETRVTTTDPAARARFRRYWAVFSPGILLIRHEALRILARDSRRCGQQHATL